MAGRYASKRDFAQTNGECLTEIADMAAISSSLNQTDLTLTTDA
jgi:hypothetical protein